MEKKADRNDKLKVLCLEDSPQDVELMRELLTEAGFELDMDCTMVEEEFVSFLRRSIYDIILADFKLPGFDAFGALRHAAEICPEVPFICVSGTIGEESAVKLLRQGAVDYVLKDRMTRLPAAIKRALIEAKEKLLHKQAEEALNLEYSRHKRFVDSNIVGVVIAAANGKILEANDYYLNMLGFTRREFESGKIDWRAITPTESLPADEKAIRELHERGTCTPYEKEYRRKDGTIVPVFLADTLLPGPEEQIGAFVLDITERKRAEESIRKSESQLRAVLDATRFPVALVDVSDKNIEYWSRSALTLFG
ncbi:MAG: PAS domain S-box protein, partial [Bacteroidota bacterium]